MFQKQKCTSIIPVLNMQTWPKPYIQIFQEFIAQVSTCLMWTTCGWIVLHTDYWPHLLDSLRMFALSLPPDTGAERITLAIANSKLSSRACVCVYVCVCAFCSCLCVCLCNSEASVPLVMLTQQQPLLLLWPTESCEADTRKKMNEKRVWLKIRRKYRGVQR